MVLIVCCLPGSTMTWAQSQTSQRTLAGPMQSQSPLQQFRLLQQLTPATPRQQLAQLSERMGIDAEVLHQLSQKLQKQRALFPRDIPPEVLRRFGENPELQREFARLQQKLMSGDAGASELLPRGLVSPQPEDRPLVDPGQNPDRGSAPRASATAGAAGSTGRRRAARSGRRRSPDRTGSGQFQLPQEVNEALDQFLDLPRTGNVKSPAGSAARQLPSPARPSSASGPGQDAGGSSLPEVLSPEVLRELKRVAKNGTQPVRPGGGPVDPEQQQAAAEMLQKLSRSGLKDTLRDLVRTAQREVRSGNSSVTTEATDESGWRRSLARAMDTVKDDVVDLVRDQQRSSEQRRNPARSTARRSPSHQRHFEDPDRPSTTESSSAAAAKSPSAAATSPQRPAVAGDRGPELLVTGSPTVPLFVGVIVAGLVAALLLRRSGRKVQKSWQQQVDSVSAVKPHQIRSREDIIRAWHWLTRRSSPESADWWNHVHTGRVLTDQTPHRKPSVQELSRLYEQARYLPADRPLDEEAIQQARAALSGCLS